MRRKLICCLLALALAVPAAAAVPEPAFDVSEAVLARALALDAASRRGLRPVGWIDLLAAAAAAQGGGEFPASAVDAAALAMTGGMGPRQLLGDDCAAYGRFRAFYGAVLGGLAEDGALTAYSPIAAGWDYTHYADFGDRRAYGFDRLHLGNDLLADEGTPVIAIEGGTVTALGWNRYGGWRVGVRSDDGLRYYYYAHLRRDCPYAPGLAAGSRVDAGDVLGYVGRTGYSDVENTENLTVPHLHLGLQLYPDRPGPECWVDVYALVELLNGHRAAVTPVPGTGHWQRAAPPA